MRHACAHVDRSGAERAPAGAFDGDDRPRRRAGGPGAAVLAYSDRTGRHPAAVRDSHCRDRLVIRVSCEFHYMRQVRWLRFATMTVRASREVVFDASPEAIMDALADIEGVPAWSPLHKHTEVVDRHP